MKSIIAETERKASPRTPPKDGSPTAKWTPRTPMRAERMPPALGLSMSSSPGKRVDWRISPATMAGPSTIVRPETTSSGLSITRPQGVDPVPAVTKQQAQSPQKAVTPKPSAHIPPPLTRSQSAQVSQPIAPVKFGPGSPSVRRTSLVSSLDRTPLMLTFILLGVAASRGRMRPTTLLATVNHPKAV